MKYLKLFALLLVLPVLMTACGRSDTETSRCGKLLICLKEKGFECQILPLEEARDVPIYKASAWQRLMLNEEEVLLYFDESNRADFHVANLRSRGYSHVARFGLRFVLLYEGENEAVIRALEDLPAE